MAIEDKVTAGTGRGGVGTALDLLRPPQVGGFWKGTKREELLLRRPSLHAFLSPSFPHVCPCCPHPRAAPVPVTAPSQSDVHSVCCGAQEGERPVRRSLPPAGEELRFGAGPARPLPPWVTSAPGPPPGSDPPLQPCLPSLSPPGPLAAAVAPLCCSGLPAAGPGERAPPSASVNRAPETVGPSSQTTARFRLLI